MPLKPTEIAQNMLDAMRKHNLNVVTMNWPQFYEFAERDRIRDEMMENVAEVLSAHDILMFKGKHVVVFARDYNFASLPQG